ncbi:MAG: YihY/virulence factor BrkB family protein [Cyclobacteriaceae bacterium]|nr:YihY/virulence factor BrkB family protein [Cyclobacteriaceae bacterium]MCX7636633.1 YihY/virulence factor BrkB family protein [Cyclobacteriaceae bacterium]MDW8331867.1 YihY/virulence factor BrkB family protein [Cyclobacteriaceae bacterium]
MKFRYKRYFFAWTPSRFLINRAREIRFKKWNNVSLYTIIKLFIRNLTEDEIIGRANSVAFNFTLAIFPAIIFLFTLIPYVSIVVPEVNAESIMVFLESMMPPNMYDVVASTIQDIVSNQRGGLLTFGFLFSMYLSTNGMMALMSAFNAVYKTDDRRGAFKMRLIATALTLNLAFVLFLAIILLVVGQLVLDYLMSHLNEFEWLTDANVWLLLLLRFAVIFIVFFLAVSTIYYFGPAIHYNWRFFSIGSLLATIFILAISYGFSYYVTHFGTYNKVYGSIGVLIALMIWIQLITIVLLVGYELNASIHDAARMQALWHGKRFRKKDS